MFTQDNTSGFSDVTFKLEAVKHNSASGTTWIKLRGDSDFDWILAHHPETPDGFVSIGGASNGSFNLLEKTAFERMKTAENNHGR